ncbi:hypothetical protein F4824DRAFT_492315 [Ustulina deusta]|nr:hypothetical protein F4824DRAFT_492315 [Ustulina deusta]
MAEISYNTDNRSFKYRHQAELPSEPPPKRRKLAVSMHICRKATNNAPEDLRTDVSGLHVNHPELARKFHHLREELEPQNKLASVPDKTSTLWQDKPNQRYQAARNLEDLINEIRQIPYFQDFLLPPRKEAMQDASKKGPLIVINVSEYRCDAILIQPQEIRLLELPNLKKQDIVREAMAGDLGSSKVLKWLWKAPVDSVLSKLGYTQCLGEYNKWPRVWWIPTGLLSKFPLHAAGLHAPHSTKTTLGRVISSYGSSVKALIHARHHGPQESTTVNLKNIILLGFKIDEPASSRGQVLSSRETCDVFHFASHGSTNPFDPSLSCLLLSDWETQPLTVTTLLETNLRRRRPSLAFLAFQLAGFRHTIGTLWEVSDKVCADMALLFYEVIMEGGLDDESVSRGLHRAGRRLRDRWLKENFPDIALGDYGRRCSKNRITNPRTRARDVELCVMTRDLSPPY